VDKLSYENVKLWFAKNDIEQIITIDEINDENKNHTYLCPVCGSNLKPKATKSKQVTSHFAHVDASKCNSESQIHFWFKHKFLEKGDKFTVDADEVKEYVCQDILVEHPYEIENGTYKPDVTILTECGNTIYFEMAFTNKKNVKDYLDIWLELKNIVVEVDIKQLMFKNEIPTFKAIFYDGKCFNIKRNDTYYNTIGKYKEEKLNGKVNEELKERIRKLDWFWGDLLRYKNGEVDIAYMIDMFSSFDDKYTEEQNLITKIIIKQKCVSLLDDYKKCIIDHLNDLVELYKTKFKNIELNLDYQFENPKKKYIPIFDGFSISIFDNMIKARKTNELDSYFFQMYNFYYKNYELNKPLRKIESLFNYTSVCTCIDNVKYPIKLTLEKDDVGENFIKIKHIGNKKFTEDEINEIPKFIKDYGFLTLENAHLLNNITKEIKEKFKYFNDTWEIQTSISSFNDYTLTLKSKNNRVRKICGNEYLYFDLKLPKGESENKAKLTVNYEEVDYDYNKDSEFKHFKSIILSKISWIVDRVKPLDDYTLNVLNKLKEQYAYFEYNIKNPNEVLINIHRTKQSKESFEIIMLDYKLYMSPIFPNWRSVKSIVNGLLENIPNIDCQDGNISSLIYELNKEYGFDDKYSRKYRFLFNTNASGYNVIELAKTGYYKDGETVFTYNVFDDILTIKDKLVCKLSTIAKEKHTCVECYKSFSLTFGECEFYDKKGFKYPKRCKSCRSKRK
jgi:hypothetical protein